MQILYLWDSDTNRMNLCYNYCKQKIWGGVICIKHHLACTHVDVQLYPQVYEAVKNFFIEYLGQKQQKDVMDEFEGVEEGVGLNPIRKGSMDTYVARGKEKLQQQLYMNQISKKNEPVIRDICRCIYANALLFNLVKDTFWKKMLVLVGEYGKG